jgi:lysophospholipase
MRLYEVPGNPIPQGAVCGRVETDDGIGLRYARWPALGVPRGTVCLFQGRAETIEKYFEVVGDLRARGFAVATFDWRGQGGSDRLLPDPQRGYVADFADYERDLQAFRRHIALPDCPPPFFALAHSMGAQILLSAAPRLSPWIERMVLTAPFLDLAPLPISRKALVRFFRLAYALGLGDRYPPGARKAAGLKGMFGGNLLTSDERRFKRLLEIVRVAPEITVGAPTFGWVDAAFRAIALLEAPDAVERLSMPTLLIASGSDRLVSTRAIELLSKRLRTCGYVLVPGARHELMMERDLYRDQFWAAFDAFVPGSAAEFPENDVVQAGVAGGNHGAALGRVAAGP